MTGSLGFAQVGEVLENAQNLISHDSLDLSGVTSIDSAGVSLLLELTRRERAKGKAILIRGANRRVRELITFFRVGELLQFESGEGSQS